jgi:ACS family sodium-dependent inorganic phosphate cotransporter
MVILGFMLNYALRVNLTIAIVAMVRHVTNSTAVNSTDIGANLTTTTEQPYDERDANKFDWDTVQQNFVLGSFFWGYVLTELPGGRLAELIGGHRVFGHSMLWASIITLLTPTAAFFNFNALICLRVLLGFMLGASWPAIHPMTAVWIPPLDRSKFMSNMMASSLGAAITMPVCGFLIDKFDWEWAFYSTGTVGLIWSICWFIFIYETPAVHPRISDEERREIEEAIGSSTSKKRPSYVPWVSIFTSPAVWAIILTHGASVFGYFTVVNQLPTYMKYILNYNIKENGILSSFPYFGKYFMAVAASYLADHLRQKGALSTTAARKIFTTFAVASPGILMILQIFFGQDQKLSVAIFTISLTLNGAVTAGYLGNGLDIAPNFSGTIFGLANTLSSFGGFLSTWMVGVITYKSNTYAEWQIVFTVLACTYLLGSLSFLIMGSGELQPWNNPPEKENPQDGRELEEVVPLQTKT